jgi:hypothetical protein
MWRGPCASHTVLPRARRKVPHSERVVGGRCEHGTDAIGILRAKLHTPSCVEGHGMRIRRSEDLAVVIHSSKFRTILGVVQLCDWLVCVGSCRVVLCQYVCLLQTSPPHSMSIAFFFTYILCVAALNCKQKTYFDHAGVLLRDEQTIEVRDILHVVYIIVQSIAFRRAFEFLHRMVVGCV